MKAPAIKNETEKRFICSYKMHATSATRGTYCKGPCNRRPQCGCGWECSGHPDRILKIVMMHAKRCDMMDTDYVKDLSRYTYAGVNNHTQNLKKNETQTAIRIINGVPEKVEVAKGVLVMPHLELD